ncbi:MAG: tetratricopeptide repeat protein [Elusimicrobiota bacterium]|jgi:TolA-binding protein
MRYYVIIVLICAGGYWAKEKYLGTFNPLEGMINVAQKNPDPVWSPRLQYWAGMVYYQKSDYNKSQQVFHKLLTDYPTAYCASKALIRLNLSAQENRDWSAAKTALEKYIEQFPGGKDAALAKSTLDKLNYEHP